MKLLSEKQSLCLNTQLTSVEYRLQTDGPKVRTMHIHIMQDSLPCNFTVRFFCRYKWFIVPPSEILSVKAVSRKDLQTMKISILTHFTASFT